MVPGRLSEHESNSRGKGPFGWCQASSQGVLQSGRMSACEVVEDLDAQKGSDIST